MNPEDYWWYMRPAGATAAAVTRASASGFERMVMYLTGIGNIRDVELASPHRGQRRLLILQKTRDTVPLLLIGVP